VRRVWLLLALAGGCAAAAAVLLLGALDVHRWQARLAEDDVRFRAARSAELWASPALIPGDPVRRLLALDDDLRYRRGVQSFVAAHPRQSAFEHPELEAARVEALVELREILVREPDLQRRSEVGNLLGAMAIVAAPSQQPELRVQSLETAAILFADAVRLDRTNQDAMFNLEVVLRRLQDEPLSFQSPGGRVPRDEASLGGLRPGGTGY
jgi:hypothetical protein